MPVEENTGLVFIFIYIVTSELHILHVPRFLMMDKKLTTSFWG